MLITECAWFMSVHIGFIWCRRSRERAERHGAGSLQTAREASLHRMEHGMGDLYSTSGISYAASGGKDDATILEDEAP